MLKRRIVVLGNDETWNQYLKEAFEDTASRPELTQSAQEALPLLRQGNPDVVFVASSLITKPLGAALAGQRGMNPQFRIFLLGPMPREAVPLFSFDEAFGETPPGLFEFQKKLTQHLPLPDPVRLLVVDDEPGVGEIFRDYFDHRTNPSFVVDVALDGLEGEKRIGQEPPHVLVLDIKMPGRDGRELYRELKKREKLPPTIVFFDLVSADEVLEIRRWGNPAFVEKGSQASGMPEMASLIKKLAYFG
jgi:DNA-binding response OmpR family regulator